MDTLDNIRCFLVVVRSGSFSAAARALDTVPSVVSKRVSQLEHRLRTPLFVRSTRRLELTEAGQRYHRRFGGVIAAVDEALRDLPERAALQGRLRVKCPTTLAIRHFGGVMIDFQRDHPDVHIDLVLMDRSMNPSEEGFDVAIGALPTTYPNVVDVPLCRMPRVLVAAPAYLQVEGMPQHPGDLGRHRCVVFPATGTTWTFHAPGGPVSVEVPGCFSVNDSQMLLQAAERGIGLAMLARYIARPALEAGRLVEVLPQFTVPPLTVKAMVPENRRTAPAVKALLQRLVEAAQPDAPWDRTPQRPPEPSPAPSFELSAAPPGTAA